MKIVAVKAHGPLAFFLRRFYGIKKADNKTT